MKKTFLAAMFMFALPFVAHAEFTGPGSLDHPSITDAREALRGADDSLVELEGHIATEIRHEHYVFEDRTGHIDVEIDDKYMPIENIDNRTLVRLYGEIDRGFNGVKVDVKHVEVVE